MTKDKERMKKPRYELVDTAVGSRITDNGDFIIHQDDLLQELVDLANEAEPFVRLIKWVSEKKSHSVKISCGDGYGADCWEVVLRGVISQRPDGWIVSEKDNSAHAYGSYGSIYAQECSFFELKPPLAPNCVFASDPFDDDAETFPGLGATITVALDRAEETKDRSFTIPRYDSDYDDLMEALNKDE